MMWKDCDLCAPRAGAVTLVALVALLCAGPAWAQDRDAPVCQSNDEAEESAEESAEGEEVEEGAEGEETEGEETEGEEGEETEGEEGEAGEETAQAAPPPKPADPPINWFPGWTVGLQAGWLFTDLEELNVPILEPNGIDPIDATGGFFLEAKGGPYLTRRALVNAILGSQTSIGSDTTFSMIYAGLEPALVFPEHRFEFILGLKLAVGAYDLSGTKRDAGGAVLNDAAGYDGAGLIVDPSLTFRYIAFQNLAVDLSVGFWQFIVLSRNDHDGAVDLNEVNRDGDTPLDWAAPHVTLGFVYGHVPHRPPRRLSPDEDEDLDGVLNKDDKCPREAEDKDGFEDEDGCPEADNDGDGLLDGADKCPDQHEDIDGFQDEDGCPDLDDDQDGVPDKDDQCRREAEDKDGFEDADGCPDTDNDKDGILDKDDKCPDEAEDKDGFKDEDGCPEPDNDDDGILDKDDKCPTEPETINGVEDQDGCPDTGGLVEVDCEKVNIKDTVFFDTGKATIQKKSFGLLDAVAQVLNSQQRIRKVRVEGHTDDVGDDAKNEKLSQERADAVMKYLIDKGVSPERLLAKGWGEKKPAQPIEGVKGAQLKAVRAVNRRVEFLIMSQEACKK